MPAPSEESALIKELVALSSKNGKLVRSSKYAAPADASISVRSWKMNEHKYYAVPSPFPTLARGLFTVEEDNGEHRIVARGYDKFFNIGEVGWTTWPVLEAHTTAPYTLSLKSNGCIVFIAALTPDKLLITSKHSIGAAGEEGKLSHAAAGEGWLRKYLAEKGHTEADLAAVLWERNLTAIAELCDDSFEEHVLAIPPEFTGLHLHGLNERTKAFTTLPHAEVDAFAAEWGFIQTASTELPTIAAVRAFTTEVGKTGSWNGVPVEGFVIRTSVAPPPSASSQRSTPPYPPGASFFFKVKFDEPYMMYRDWREVTKSLITMRGGANGKGKMSVEKLSKNKMRRAETQAYARWVIEEIQKDPAAFAQYQQNKGIIAVRDRFLAYLASDKGKKVLGSLETKGQQVGAPSTKQFSKTIIVPVAVPGCGKTAVAVALSHIFGFAHTQSDDVHVKKAAPVFIKNVTELLKTHDVVIADKNNHLQQHREALRGIHPSARLLALHWGLDTPPATLHRICADRVLARGENHQTLRADAAAKTHEDVLWMFITTAEPLAPAEVDEVVDMDLGADLEAAVQRAVDACVRILELPAPGAETVREGVERARGYAPRVKKPDAPAGAGAGAGKKAKDKGDGAPRYFALLPEMDLAGLLAPVLDGTPFWDTLQAGGRVAKRSHVTLVHKNALQAGEDAVEEATAFWARCMGLHAAGAPPLFRFRLGSVVWNERVMAVTVEGLELGEEGGDGAGRAGAEFVEKLPEEAKGRLHITVGTRDANVPPVEAKGLVEAWRRAGEGGLAGVQSVPLGGVVVGRVKGLQA
ncbi:RNA ligase-domain-containing protein [Mycena galericulata]|nr:RNA ligase-domain-containing protein [Mycena galericulata]